MPTSKLLENTIFKKDDGMLYISDLDSYKLSDSESLDSQNQTELQFIYYQFFTQYSSDYYNGIYNDLFEELFFQNITHEKSITEKLEDLFSSYDMPKQFFKDNKRRYGKKHF